ncbi:MAG TPA: aminoglycoside 6-adenylyltransferase [Candidatus Andersenbacteria bacterium]|nr:aminoglycoside 6-adenylyltransferase [Candidatus Andersenbacteria bacterium]
MNGDELLGNIVRWANENENILAIIQTGSHARSDEMVDEFSDYDIELIGRDNTQLVQSDDWIQQFGLVWIQQSFKEGQDYPTKLVIYESGIKVDFTLADEQRILNMNAKLDDLYQRGYKVLLDKFGITKKLPKPTGQGPTNKPPTQDEYLAAVGEFWFEASHIPKYLVREDLWVVKFRDWTMKEMMLKMLEWYAITRTDYPAEVWHIGTHIQHWLEPKKYDRLQLIFAHFDGKDSWKALLAELDLFRDISRAVADQLGYQYPTEMDMNISNYVRSFEGRL